MLALIHISIHALHEESDKRGFRELLHEVLISIHALHEESDSTSAETDRTPSISIHALHEESDSMIQDIRDAHIAFQSTLSMRRATPATGRSPAWRPFQSTLSMRRATGLRRAQVAQQAVISIHALHEESDSAAGHFCPLFETQASCLALSISNNTADTTNNMSKTSNWLSVSF